MSKPADSETKTTGELTKHIANIFIDRGLSLTTAESCTGGNLAAALCAESDTAAFYDIGVVTFSDSAKQKMLGVQASTLEKYTAVSEQTVREMAEGVRVRAGTDISMAISGYAGPDGGDDGTPLKMGGGVVPAAPLPVRSGSHGISVGKHLPGGNVFPGNARPSSKRRSVTAWQS